MNAKDLQTYKRFKDQITLSESVYETAYYEGEYKGFEKGIEKGIEQGIEQGKREREIKMVINGFKEDSSIEFIARMARIPEIEVYDILEKHPLK